MKLKTDVFTICEYASVDNEGRLSLNGIFKEMNVTKMPAYFLRFYIGATLSGDPEKVYDLNISIIGPDDKIVNHEETSLQLGLGGVAHLVTDIHNFPIEQVGQYSIVLKTNDQKVVGKTTFNVIDMTSARKTIN